MHITARSIDPEHPQRKEVLLALGLLTSNLITTSPVTASTIQTLLDLANKTRYLDTSCLTAIEKHITDKALRSLSTLECIQIYSLVNQLFMKQPVLERVEAHVVGLLLAGDFKDRPHLIKKYLGVFTLNRKKTSRRQIEDCLKVIDKYYSALTIPASEQRATLQTVLHRLETLTRKQDLHEKVMELAFRDPTLQVDE
jgi:hypothetical protein